MTLLIWICRGTEAYPLEGKSSHTFLKSRYQDPGLSATQMITYFDTFFAKFEKNATHPPIHKKIL